jgi:hypothetical protein
MSDSLILKFCQAISGVDETSQRQAESVIREARNRFSDETVDCLLERFAKGGISEVTVDECLAGVARAITFFLYVGVLPDAEGQELSAESSTKLIIREPSDYFESLIWRVIQAHPPALSGGYFGHWFYPPEDLHE